MILKKYLFNSGTGIEDAIPKSMNHVDRHLLRHIVIAVLVKLLVLTALWWGFVRDARVSVDTESAAARITVSATTQGKSK